jgi:uncharacterized metal-binding protein YceD (DUF177 family)
VEPLSPGACSRTVRGLGVRVFHELNCSRGDEDVDADVDENMFFIGPETNKIDLKEVVREYIVLSVPMRKVPEEKDGVCCFCKKNIEEILRKNKEQEINPVWNKLLNKN